MYQRIQTKEDAYLICRMHGTKPLFIARDFCNNRGLNIFPDLDPSLLLLLILQAIESLQTGFNVIKMLDQLLWSFGGLKRSLQVSKVKQRQCGGRNHPT